MKQNIKMNLYRQMDQLKIMTKKTEYPSSSNNLGPSPIATKRIAKSATVIPAKI